MAEGVSEDQKRVEEKTSCATKIETRDKGKMEIASDPILTRNPLMLVQGRLSLIYIYISGIQVV